MPNQAHEFFEKELKETLTELFDHIYDDATFYDKWFGNRAEECEWQDRDGFWSWNNGGLEMSLMASSTILSEGHGAPCINEWYESYNKELVEEAEKNDDYQEWKKENPDSTVNDWLAETSEGNDFEMSMTDAWSAEPPFLKVTAFLQNPDGHQFEGKVEPDSILKLHFDFCFNDDLGYGRSHISWCPGVGDHQKCGANIIFIPKDIEEVRDIIRTELTKMADLPDSEQRETVTFETKSLKAVEA